MSVAQAYEPVSALSARSAWADQARGVGIVLVVFGHAWRGIHEAGLISHQRAFEVVDRLIYSFHMPLFFLLAGLFFERALFQKSTWPFVMSRISRMIYPLVLWTYIFAAFKAAAGSFANNPLGWGQVLVWPLPPKFHFWFLWALFLIQIAALSIRPLLLTASDKSRIWLAVLGLTILICFVPLGTGPWVPFVNGALYNAPFFVLGVVISRHGLPLRGHLAVIMAILAFIVAEWLALSQPRTLQLQLLVGSLASVAVCILAYEASRVFAGSGWMDAIGSIGRISMAIYLSHTIFSAAARVAMQQVGITSIPLHMTVGLAVGLSGPALLLLVAQRTRSVRLLGF